MLLFTILIAFVSLMALMVIHEFGHFILAKKFGTEVEEFGIGYPPRILGKKFGETIYSLNLIPFGAFVKIKGEEGGVENYRSFTDKPIWQRILIVLGGVVSFWIVAAILLTIVAGVWGLPVAVDDSASQNIVDPKVQISRVLPDSPAGQAGIEAGDTLVGFSKISEVENLIAANLGKETTLTVKRGQDLFEKKITPRLEYSTDEGAVGVVLIRTALEKYSWWQAPIQGVRVTANLTANIVKGWGMGIKSLLGIEELPADVKMELRGPLGILEWLQQYSQMGANYFLFFVALISTGLALANLLPIPSLDGGKMVFLLIEAIRGRAINYKIEQRVTAAFFISLILLMIFITVKFDIPRIF
jgi:regulator of sigma E protease